MKRYSFIFFFSIASLLTYAQETLTLQESYLLAKKNYPKARQSNLLEEKTNSEISLLKKEGLPQLHVDAQASYQSEVIKFPLDLPNMDVKAPNKDQYRAVLEANQLIYNGGNIQARTRLKTAEMETQQQELTVDLYTLNARINQYFFQVLLFQEQINLLNAKMEQLKTRAKEVESGVKHGAVLASSGQLLQAETLTLEQQLAETHYNRKKAVDNLSLLLAQDLDENIELLRPDLPISFHTASQRPELKLFELQQDQLESSKAVLDKGKAPKLFGFAQAGYGNPGLNMLDNSFQDFYLVGLKLNWNVFDWGKTKQQRQTVAISKELINTEKETFELNNRMQLKEAKNEIDKYEEILAKDNEIIQMRENVLESTTVQLQNGVITSAEYITELNRLYEAQINQQVHEVQLLLAKANYNIVNGELIF